MTATPVYKPANVAPIPRLALRQAEAAKSLGISDKTLSQWTKAGLVPHFIQGGCVLYPVCALEAWLAERSQTGNENSRNG